MHGLGKSRRSLAVALAGLLLFAVVVFAPLGRRTAALDSPTVDFSSDQYTTGEGSSKVTITVQLSVPSPGTTIDVDYATSDGSATAGEDYAAANETLTFPPGETSQTFDVTILEDDLDEDDEDVTLTLTLPDPNIANLGSNNPAVLTIQDNDGEPTVDWSSATYNVGEADGSKMIQVQLDTISGRTVEVFYGTANGSAEADKDYTAANGKLTFDPGVTTQEFAVTILEDNLDENDEDVTLMLSSPSHAALGGNNPATLTIQDNDSSGIVVAPTTLTVSEPDESGSFKISLESAPKSQVTIDLSTSNGECSVSPASVALTSSNWSIGESVTVTAVDDDIDDGLQICTVETSAASSDDGSYSGIDPTDVTVNVLDDNQAGVKVTPTQVEVTEGGTGDSYEVVLTSEPTHSVRVTVTSDDQLTASPKQLNFDKDNWNSAQSVVVLAVNDSWAEGAHSGTISHSVRSSDGKYDGLKPSRVTASIQDNDGAQIIVEPTALTISEPSGSAVFTITLTSEPTSDVTISLSTLNGQCSVSSASAVLGSANWNSGTSVQVSAVDDSLQDGDQLCEVVTGDAASADPNFAGRRVQNVMVTVLDDGDRQVFLPYVVGGWPPLPAMPELLPIENSDGDGSYNVNWTAVPAAESYVLEESRDSDFATATEIYAGPSTSYLVTGQITGRYFHRVKARNSWGAGAWSTTQSADMMWEVEPNNQPPDANGPLVSGLTYHGRFPAEATGFDYYYFDVSQAGQAELWLRSIPNGEDYNLVLRDASQQLIGYSAWGGNSNESISVTLSPGRYYVQIWHYRGSGSGKAYDLRALY